MTVSTSVRTFDYAGNGTTTIFAVPFPFKAQSHLVVYLIDNSTLVETLWALGVDYTLSGGDPTGTLTATVAPASGTTLHGERTVPVVQTLDLNANDGFPSSAVEDALDLLTMMVQQDSSGGGGGGGSSITLANIGAGEDVVAGLIADQYQIRGMKASGSGLSVTADADSITYTLAGALLAANNLSDVAVRQTAINNLTDVSAATNEFVLTKDTGTGNATWKVVPASGGGLLAANNLSDVASAATSRTNLGLGTAATLDSSVFALNANNLSGLANVATARTNLGLGTAATFADTAFLKGANNLSDVASAATSRTNLGLGTAATFADTAFLKASSNLSDVANVATSRTNLGLGTAATFADTVFVKTANNLSDVASRQTALNTLTAVGPATNEFVLTKDTGTGNAIWKAVPAPGGGLLAANNLSDVAVRQTALNTLTAVGAATNEFVLTKDTGTGNAIWKVSASAGETNTISQTGAAGVSILQATPKVGVDLRTRGLIAGSNVTITPTGSVDVTIAATGEANTLSSAAATGLSLVNGKVGVDLRVKGLAATSPVALSSTSTDLTYSLNLAANIDWTGRHKIEKNVGDVIDTGYNLAVYGLNGGALVDSGILLESLYRTVVDVRKTSVAGSDGPRGSSHGIYVQHRVTGTAVSGDRLFGGIRSAVQNAATGIPTEITAFYGAINMTANNPNASWGFFCDVFHSSVHSGSDTRGYGAEVIRTSSAGRCTGYEAIMMDASTQNGTAAFIARRQSGSSPAWNVGFAVGDSASAANATVGFDTAYATIGSAAFRMASGHLFRMGGTTDAGDIRYSSSDTAIQMMSGGNRTFGIENTGIPVFYETSGTIVGGAGGASPLPATPVRYINVRYNTGTLASPVIATGKVPIFSF